ncbi:hypothetical protein RZ50_028155, partial [Kitasatospora sp. SUK 42]|nr:hypothetical protein [Kitasatospora sp. SUK 42]
MSNFRILSGAGLPAAKKRRAVRFAAVATTSAMGLGMLGIPTAFAVTATSGTPAAEPALTAVQKSVLDARAKAKSTGKPVVVDAMTTETSLTLIN